MPKGLARAQCPRKINSWEGCKTDPEPDMGGGRASARNMRSKCRCSYVLQFTFRRAVCCVLHRPPSQVIHCAVLSLWQKPLSPFQDEQANNQQQSFIPPRGEREAETQRRRQNSLSGAEKHRTCRRANRDNPREPDGSDMTLCCNSLQQTSRKPNLEAKLPSRELKLTQPLGRAIANDPTAGSPTVTLLRLLLPLNAQVWESSRTTQSARTNWGPVQIPH